MSDDMREFLYVDDGEVYVMGTNDHGQLGSKQKATSISPMRVQALDMYQLVHMAIGQVHMLAITEKVTP